MQPCLLLVETLLISVQLAEDEPFLALAAVLVLMVLSVKNTQDYGNHTPSESHYCSLLLASFGHLPTHLTVTPITNNVK
jgi:hypothetical protein